MTHFTRRSNSLLLLLKKCPQILGNISKAAATIANTISANRQLILPAAQQQFRCSRSYTTENPHFHHHSFRYINDIYDFIDKDDVLYLHDTLVENPREAENIILTVLRGEDVLRRSGEVPHPDHERNMKLLRMLLMYPESSKVLLDECPEMREKFYESAIYENRIELAFELWKMFAKKDVDRALEVLDNALRRKTTSEMVVVVEWLVQGHIPPEHVKPRLEKALQILLDESVEEGDSEPYVTAINTLVRSLFAQKYKLLSRESVDKAAEFLLKSGDKDSAKDLIEDYELFYNPQQQSGAEKDAAS